VPRHLNATPLRYMADYEQQKIDENEFSAASDKQDSVYPGSAALLAAPNVLG
jgi:hypothetical protein